MRQLSEQRHSLATAASCATQQLKVLNTGILTHCSPLVAGVPLIITTPWDERISLYGMQEGITTLVVRPSKGQILDDKEDLIEDQFELINTQYNTIYGLEAWSTADGL
jgi:hypothetical protein